jgi:tol-pal system protein YbgF
MTRVVGFGRFFRWFALAGLLALVTVPPAWSQSAGEMRAIIQRLTQIENQLRDVERSVYRGEVAATTRPPAAAPAPVAPREADLGPVSQRLTALDDRIDGIESEMAKLTGQVETAAIELRQIRTRLDKLVADIDFRLNELEKRPTAEGPPAPAASPQTLAAPAAAPANGRPTSREAQIEAARQASTRPLQAPGQTQPQTQTAAATPARSVLPAGPPDKQYEYARGILTKLDYPGAQVAFAEFLQRHRDHELAANAHYWLGESFYGQKNYGDAASAFVEGYKRFPKAQKAPDSLLKLGLSLASLGQRDDACSSWGQLLTAYPNAEPQTRRRAEQERTRLGCR